MTGTMMHHQRTTCGCQWRCCSDPSKHSTLRAREKRRWRKEEW